MKSIYKSKQLHFCIKLTKNNSKTLRKFLLDNFPSYKNEINGYIMGDLNYGNFYGFNKDYYTCVASVGNIPLMNITDVKKCLALNKKLELKLQKELEMKKEIKSKTFPRLMYVGNIEKDIIKDGLERMVLGKFGARYVAIKNDYEGQLEKGTDYDVHQWEHAIDLPAFVELTIDAIAKKFGIKPEQVKIIK